ncbi:MAG: hypothetical protein ACD_34C00121G0002 [uncultured bacterium]|nr:MAG: hypothetical protein ACD_34C00121G0002 [uncultured bacterium]
MTDQNIPENIAILELNHFRWITIEQPSKEALQYLKTNFNFHVLDYEDIVATTHRSKIDKYPDYVFMIMLFPLLQHKTHTIHSGEIDFFLGKDYLITIHRGDVPTFVDMFQLCEASEQARLTYMANSPQYLLYKILQRLFQYCYPILDQIDSDIDKIESNIFSTGQQSLLQEILVTRHTIADMRRIIQPHRQTLSRLYRPTTPSEAADDAGFQLDDKYEDYFDDLRDYTQEIWNQLESFKESIEALHETNQSLISYRINEVIRTLTIFSAIMLPAGVVASLFGMNADFIPFAGVKEDFFIFAGFTFLAMLATLLYIRRKRLL